MSDLPVPPVPVDVDALTELLAVDDFLCDLICQQDTGPIRPRVKERAREVVDVLRSALAEVVTLRAENAGLDGLVDAMSDDYGEEIGNLAAERDSWRVRAETAEARIEDVHAVATAARILQPADPDTGDRDVSWLAIVEALDGSS